MNTISLTTWIFATGIVLVLWYRVYLLIMRTGSLNPVDWIWGPRLYDVTQLDNDILLCEINQFPGDEYMIDWRINMTETYRDKGPWFVRKRKWVAFSACWQSEDVGIPISGGYIRDTWIGVFDIKDPFDWRYDADEALKNWVRSRRRDNGYVGQITDFEETPEGLFLKGVVWDGETQLRLSEGVIGEMSIGYDGFGAPISNPAPDSIITSTSDNDLLKSKYTLEELAQQAINRDNEEALMDEPKQDTIMHGPYPEEVLNEDYNDEDNGTMPEGVQALRDAVIGHKVVKVEKGGAIPEKKGTYRWNTTADVTLTLDNGKRVALIGVSDCCAHGSVDAFVEKLPLMDHIITDVGTTGKYTKWHLLTDMEDVLQLDVDWSPGNAFYYAYGVEIEVYEIPDTPTDG